MFRQSLHSVRGVRFALLVVSLLIITSSVHAQRKRHAKSLGGVRAVVIDEHLAALRAEPRLNGAFVRRLGRGRTVAIYGSQFSKADEVAFYRISVTRRTGGWLQTESVAVIGRAGEDARLLRLIQASSGYERIARAQIFLDNFTVSRLRPVVLLIYADAAEDVATRLTRDAARRLKEDEMTATNAPRHSYFLNYSGLDRYNKQGVNFVFDRATNALHYEGARWREIVRRYPQSAEAREARERLERIASRSATNSGSNSTSQ